jgi:hypothetical protein
MTKCSAGLGTETEPDCEEDGGDHDPDGNGG